MKDCEANKFVFEQQYFFEDVVNDITIVYDLLAIYAIEYR